MMRCGPMPGGSGRPAVAIILVSGDSQSAAGAMELGVPLMMKPYDLPNIVQKIDEVAPRTVHPPLSVAS